MKAGKVYVPLDAVGPSERARHILADTGAALVLTHGPHLAQAHALGEGRQVLDVDRMDPGPSIPGPAASISPGALAYVLYTSGSGGPPKGVVQDHRGLLHQIKRETNSLRMCAEDRVLLVRALSAIGGVRIVFGALLNGASVHPLSLAAAGQSALIDLLRDDEITIYDSTPTAFRHFVARLTGAERFPHLRLIRLSSEPASSRDAELYRRHFPPPCMLVNSLGVTEAGGSARHYFIDHDTPLVDGTLPVGYAVEGVDVVILDDAGGEVAPDHPGQIGIRSRHLPPGYWRRPDLTEAKYRPDLRDPDARVYLSGDLGRMRPDGCLLHLGRRDFLVKVRGQFVDVAEVESRLGALDAVAEAVELAAGAPGEARLVAYVVPRTSPPPTVSSLRRALAESLPAHMIRAAFVTLAAMPLTPTGKVDRRALPAPGRERPDLDAAYVAPATAIESRLAAIWADVLALERVGTHDNFFDLGGDSLTLTDAHARLRDALGRDVTLVEMFEHPTIAALARALDEGAPIESQGAMTARDRARKRRETLSRLTPPARPPA
jgi:acyl-coenzyme A synthetase/AMP-(fatty) acid ligase/aryl carrier-like protein